jgi:hypothetical protein
MPTQAPVVLPSQKPSVPWYPLTSSLQGSLEAVMANALAEGSAHIVFRNVAPKHGVSISSQNDGLTDGIQRERVGKARIVIRVVGSTTYFTANRVGFIKSFRFTPAQASEASGQWIPLTSADPGYAPVTDGVTLSSMLQELAISAPFKRLPTRMLDGARVFGIQGRATGDGAPPHTRGTLWIRLGVHPLPVEFTSGAKNKFRTVAVLSRWGRAVNVVAPTAIIGTQQQGISS